MTQWDDAVHAFAREAYEREVAAIEECAERILLSGTNMGIEVHTWIHEGGITITAEPSTRTSGILRHPTVFGPAPD